MQIICTYKQKEKTMSEFCPECFLKLHPEYTKNSLVVMRGLDWCEECGKEVNKIVINVQEPLYKSERLCYNKDKHRKE